MKPSDLKGICPMSSIHQHIENEQHMMWIISQLAKTGDVFRPMSGEEYKKLGGGDSIEYYEKEYLPYIESEATIALYSPSYKKVREQLKQTA